MNDKIYLHLEIDEDGRKRILDQDGRELYGIVRIESESEVKSVDMLSVTFYEAGPDGEVITNGGHRRG